jgi:hypothetical protein
MAYDAMFATNGSTAEYYYWQQLHDGHTAHTYRGNEYSFMEDLFIQTLNKFFTTLFILQLLPKANPIGQLLEVQLLHDLFRDWRHLLQKLLVLLICAIGG